jgi:hypothetical protein
MSINFFIIISFSINNRKFQEQNTKKLGPFYVSVGNSEMNSSIDCRNTNKRNLAIDITNTKIQPHTIRFNIGGIVFNFSQAILANYRGSLLELRYMDYSLSKNERYKEIWIARDPRLFTKLYSYLIHGNFDKFIPEEKENIFPDGYVTCDDRSCALSNDFCELAMIKYKEPFKSTTWSMSS